MTFAEWAAACPFHAALGVERRPGNALNVEIGTPIPRCTAQPPAHWKDADAMGRRWLDSGGSVFVFAPCACAGCPFPPAPAPEPRSEPTTRTLCPVCGHPPNSSTCQNQHP